MFLFLLNLKKKMFHVPLELSINKHLNGDNVDPSFVRSFQSPLK